MYYPISGNVNFQYKTTEEGIVILVVAGRILSQEDQQEVKNVLVVLASQGQTRVVADLSKLEEVGMCAAEALEAGRVTIHQAGGEIFFCNVKPDVFEELGKSMNISSFPDRQTAMQSFA